ncbi:pantoate--beta-alanine ligase [Helicobacter baculiformis]|uniref:Pantothenate synthetase n=1 Tax=Helicobacter baculiformis TaxID=427351 RepID=A0ABV7ZI97_9HELI|nr:pantoate--beta-alanine ligase [Helicobacter baculiformis]
MQVYTKASQLASFWGQEIGFVPTMGALHPGHASLIAQARAQNQIVVVSIFVNPTQFAPNEDYQAYPRTLQADIALCESLGVDVLFTPEPAQIYPFGVLERITLQPPASLLGFEADMRPKHFDGVLQVVLKLFNLVRPKRAYFGQKDAQQLLIIQRMVADLFLDIEIMPCPIVRDDDGLALSSRNVYLNSEERATARKIPQALMYIQKAIQEGERDSAQLIALGLEVLQGLKVHYLSVCDRQLAPLAQIQPNQTLILCAVQVGAVRLLDNLWV